MPQSSRPVRSADDIGSILRRLRKAQRLTQVDAAGLSDVGIRFLSELENGKPTVRLQTVLKVLAAYGVEMRLAGPGIDDVDDREPAARSDRGTGGVVGDGSRFRRGGRGGAR
jgi:y4mF family transcriptional regulator